MTTSPTSSEKRQLVYRVGGQNHQIDASKVLEVIRIPHITRVPNGPEALAGIANFRGKAIPVLTMSGVLSLAQTHDHENGRIIVYDHGEVLGLLVDEVLRFSDDNLSTPLQDLSGLLNAAFKQNKVAKTEQPHQRNDHAVAERAVNLVALLSFHVGGQLHGLPLDEVREVTRVPDEISGISGAPPAIIGLISLRDEIVPLVSLATLLGLPYDHENKAGSFLVVVEYDRELLGLVVDEIDMIRRLAEEAIDVVPTVLQQERGETQIEAIGRIAQSGQLISVLSAEKLFRHHHVTEAIATNTGAKPVKGPLAKHETTEQFLIFQLGEESYGLPVKSVEEVIRVPAEVTRVPGAPDFVSGVINHRGKALPLINQNMRFGSLRPKPSAKTRAIILTLENLRAGFVIDGVSDVKSVPSDAVFSAPEFSSERTQIFDRIARFEADGRMILLINSSELLTRAEQDVVASIAKQQTGAEES